jgi:hypothetical protein
MYTSRGNVILAARHEHRPEAHHGTAGTVKRARTRSRCERQQRADSEQIEEITRS